MKVRCNWCMNTFDEKDILLNLDDMELCPYCGKIGCLMDLKEKTSNGN